MEPRTHVAIDPTLCGRPRTLGPGTALVDFEALESMRADDAGLVHGGFVFGLADHAAMLAVNHPNVVLGAAAVRFEKPVVVGDRLTAHATLAPNEDSSKKHRVDVEVRRDDELVMRGEFTCFCPSTHVLATQGGQA